MTVEGAQIDRAARPATRAEHIEPGRSGERAARIVGDNSMSRPVASLLSADRWDVPVPTFGPRMACTGCGIIGADARPNWKEQPPRESLTGCNGEADPT
jgi:hypothetical protein